MIYPSHQLSSSPILMGTHFKIQIRLGRVWLARRLRHCAHHNTSAPPFPKLDFTPDDAPPSRSHAPPGTLISTFSGK